MITAVDLFDAWFGCRCNCGDADQEDISKLQQAYFEMSVTIKLGQIIMDDESIWILEIRRKGML